MMTSTNWASELRRINQAFAEQETRLTQALSQALRQGQASEAALQEVRTQLAAAQQAQGDHVTWAEQQAAALDAHVRREQSIHAALEQAQHDLQQALARADALEAAQSQALDEAQRAVQVLQQQAEHSASELQAERQRHEVARGQQQDLQQALARANALEAAQSRALDEAHSAVQVLRQEAEHSASEWQAERQRHEAALDQERALSQSTQAALLAATSAAAVAADREAALQTQLAQAEAQRRSDLQAHQQARAAAEGQHELRLKRLRDDGRQQETQLQQELAVQARQAQQRIDQLLGDLGGLRQELREKSDVTTMAERQHAASVQRLEDELRSTAERAQARADELQTQLLAVHEDKLRSESESDARERGLREQLMQAVAAGLQRMETQWAALEQQAGEHRAQAALREQALLEQNTETQARLHQAALDLQALRDRAEIARAELQAAQQAQVQAEDRARDRERALREEFGVALAAKHGHAAELETRLAQQVALGLQRAQGDAAALAAAQQELSALDAVRERLAAELADTQTRLQQQARRAHAAAHALSLVREHAARQQAALTSLLRRPRWRLLLQRTPAPVTALLDGAPQDALVISEQEHNAPPTGFASLATEAPAPRKGVSMNKQAPEPLRHVNELLALNGAEFVSASYREVLGRDADEHGAALFLQRVQTERDKATLLYEFATSAEGLARRQTLQGLTEVVATRDPQRGRLRRFLNKFARMDQASVRTEWLVGAMHQQLSEQLSAAQMQSEQVLAALADLAQRIDHKAGECSLRIDAAADRISGEMVQLVQLQESTAAQLAGYEEHRILDSDMQARRLSRDREFLLQQQAALASDALRGTPAGVPDPAPASVLSLSDLLLLAQNARAPGS